MEDVAEENAHSHRVRRIRQKLSEVARLGLDCAGAEDHHFRLDPPIALADLVAFEARHGIRLPEDYRTFLLEAGHGGAGPYYGLYTLNQWDEFADLLFFDEFPADFLAGRSSLHVGNNPEYGQRRKSEDYVRNVLNMWQGTLTLGTQGCTYFIQLIINGPCAGQVAYADLDGAAPYVVREKDFLSWYERWLDELLGGYNGLWFGFGPGGGETEFFAILDDPDADSERRGEAACAFRRLPHLSDAAALRMVELLSDPAPEVRTGACKTVCRFALTAAVPAAGLLLSDPDATIRKLATEAVITLAPAEWSDRVLQRLEDEPESEVCSTSLILLKQENRLPREKLLQFLVSNNGHLKRPAAYYLDWTEADVPLALRLLGSEEESTRLVIATALSEVAPPSSLPALLSCVEAETVPIIIEWHMKSLERFQDREAVPTLLKLTASEDDFNRLDAVRTLIGMGEADVEPVAQTMLDEHRQPERRQRYSASSHSETFATLIRRALLESPNPRLRDLALQGHRDS